MTVTMNQTWHLWIANFLTKRINPNNGTDICEYTRAFIAGLTWFLFVTAFASLFVLFVSASLWNLVAFGIGINDVIEFYTKLFIFMISVIALFIGIVVLKEWWDNRPVKEKPEAPPTFAKVAYRKFKSKTCFRIEFNDVK